LASRRLRVSGRGCRLDPPVRAEAVGGCRSDRGPLTLNINDREDVREFFTQVYQAPNGAPEEGMPFRARQGRLGDRMLAGEASS
jgi:hypothetical protein